MADLHGNPELALRQPRGVRGPLAHSVAAPRVRVHMAFWVMVRRVTVLAALVDLAFLVFFQAIGSPVLAWLNLVSVAMYAAAYGLLLKRKNLPALALAAQQRAQHAADDLAADGRADAAHGRLRGRFSAPACARRAGRCCRTSCPSARPSCRRRAGRPVPAPCRAAWAGAAPVRLARAAARHRRRPRRGP
jgi:hypothetical protein